MKEKVIYMSVPILAQFFKCESKAIKCHLLASLLVNGIESRENQKDNRFLNCVLLWMASVVLRR